MFAGLMVGKVKREMIPLAVCGVCYTNYAIPTTHVLC